MTKIMILRIKENKNSKFYEKCSARLFNDDEMKKLADLAAAAIMCGCEIKAEMQEMEV